MPILTGARVTRPAVPFGQDTAHSSAPSICRTATGRLLMLYRQGTDHFLARDGIFKLATSDDNGATWNAPVTVLDQRPTWDSQGQGLSESRDGTTLRMTYFKAAASNGAAGVFLRTSSDGGTSWSDETRVDPGLPYAATTDVVVETADGALLLAFYGRRAGDTSDSVWLARSRDRGATWCSARLADGQAPSLHFNEPVVAYRSDGTAVIAYRYGGSQSVGTMTSTDHGITWSTGAERFPGTGKAHVFWLNPGTLVCVYRQLSTGHAVMRYSRTAGATWSPARLVDPVMYPGGWMLYASSCDLGGGQQLVAFAQERGTPSASPGTSRIYLAVVGPAGQATPYGALPDDLEDAVAGELVFATRFEQPDGPAADPWTAVVNNGGATPLAVVEGTLRPSIQGAFTIARVFAAGATDVDIEADLLNAAGSGSAAGIVFRQTAPGTFLVFVAENTQCRLYRYASGAPTLLVTSGPITHQYDVWNRLRVVARGANLYGYYNGQLMVTATLSAADAATYAAGQWHGLKLIPQAGGASAHRCRRFVLRG
jgi:ketosteroid isomerase-like protein